MNIELKIFESVISFAVLVGIIFVLKEKKFFHEEESSSFSKLLIDIVLPATIFFQLASHQITGSQFILILIMLLCGMVTMTVSYLAGRLITKDRKKIGAFMISSSFGSSALLGYPIIKMVFPENPDAMTDAVLISEVGVGLPLFIFCPLVAMWFGSSKEKEFNLFQFVKPYFKSPIFFSLVIGIIFSMMKIDFENPFAEPVKSISEILGHGVGLLSCVILGLYLKPKSFKGVILLIIFSAVIEMGLQPYLASVLADIFGVSDIHKKILVLISSMPAAILGTVFAARYNCAPDTASVLSYSHIILALITIPVINIIL